MLLQLEDGRLVKETQRNWANGTLESVLLPYSALSLLQVSFWRSWKRDFGFPTVFM